MVSESEAGGYSARLMGLRILIAEDKFLVAERLKHGLEAAGATVLGMAPTVDGALDYVAAEPIDVALVDMDLRGEFADRLIEKLLERGIPFVIVTGFQALPNNYAGDALAVVQKPVDKDELVELLAQVPRQT